LYNYLVYFVYFYTYFYIYWYIWYILCSFGIVVPVLVCCPKKNLATLLAATNEGDCKHGHFCRPVRDTFPKRKQKLWRAQKSYLCNAHIEAFGKLFLRQIYYFSLSVRIAYTSICVFAYNVSTGNNSLQYKKRCPGQGHCTPPIILIYDIVIYCNIFHDNIHNLFADFFANARSVLHYVCRESFDNLMSLKV
jgi:hypothetical protein